VAHDRSEVHLTADLSARPAHALEASAFRIAVFGDFSGRSGGSDGAPPLSQRRPLQIDRDDVDAVLSRIAPALRLELDPREPPLEIGFAAIEDFHPDRLIERLPLFKRLFTLRSEAGAAQSASPSAPPRPAQRPESVALDMSAGSLLDRIVEGARTDAEASGGVKQAAPRDDLADFVARAVRSHVVAESTPEQRDLRAKVDDVITATMRVILHHPRFQSLESFWRGVDFLVRRLDTSETMQVFLIDVSRDELVADVAASGDGRGSIHRLLAASASGPAWSLLVGAYTFEPADAGVLANLASLGRAVGAPWLVAAHPRFVGAESFAGTDFDDWTVQRPAAWSELRTSSDAAFLSLAAPRFLLRLPYGRRGEECDAFALEELGPGSPDHASFLWGNPAFASALAIADSVAQEDRPATRARIEGLPLYIAQLDGEPVATPCAEVVLTQEAAEDMLDAGLTALVSPRDADAIILPRIQSVSTPPRPLSIRATTV
jgi:type VI secretion system protein ImpC